MIAPVLEQLSEKYAGKASIYKVDVDQSMALAAKYGIQAVPTMILFKDNKAVDTLVGFLPKERIKEVIEANL